MKSIPKHFHLAGQKILVEQVSDLVERQDCWGKWIPTSNTILLQSIDDKHPKDVVLQAFFHEAFHAILDILGHTEWSSNEVFVEQVSQLFYQMLKTKRH